MRVVRVERQVGELQEHGERREDRLDHTAVRQCLADQARGFGGLLKRGVVRRVELFDRAHVLRRVDHGAHGLGDHEVAVVVLVVDAAPRLGIVDGTRIDLDPVPIPLLDEVDVGAGEFLRAVFVADEMLPCGGEMAGARLALCDGVELLLAVCHDDPLC